MNGRVSFTMLRGSRRAPTCSLLDYLLQLIHHWTPVTTVNVYNFEASTMHKNPTYGADIYYALSHYILGGVWRGCTCDQSDLPQEGGEGRTLHVPSRGPFNVKLISSSIHSRRSVKFLSKLFPARDN